MTENCLSPFGSLAKKSSRSSIVAIPSNSPRATNTGDRIFAGSTTGRRDVISRYVPVGTVSPYTISIFTTAAGTAGSVVPGRSRVKMLSIMALSRGRRL